MLTPHTNIVTSNNCLHYTKKINSYNKGWNSSTKHSTYLFPYHNPKNFTQNDTIAKINESPIDLSICPNVDNDIVNVNASVLSRSKYIWPPGMKYIACLGTNVVEMNHDAYHRQIMVENLFGKDR